MKNSQGTTIWQIGRETPCPENSPKAGNWFPKYNYTIDCDPDPINSPSIPQLIAIPSTGGSQDDTLSTGKLNIYFTLDRSYRIDELTLFYGCFSSQETRFFLDGKPLEIFEVEQSENQLRRWEISFPSMTIGDHILTITVHSETSDSDGQVISYLKLVALPGETVDLLPIPVRENWSNWIEDLKLLNIWGMMS